jgi:hypothetical protein
VAYGSNESGATEIYVRSFTPTTHGSGGKWLISKGGGLIPVWSRAGPQLFYEAGDNRIMVVDYTIRGDSFVASPPRLWSPASLTWSGFTNLDLAPDGTRFIVFPRSESEGADPPRRITVLMNFFDDVQRRIPGR